MNALLVAARAIHFGATMLVFGEIVFVASVAGVAWRRTAAASNAGLDRHSFVVCAAALAAGALSGVAWLLVEAMQMAGATIGDVIGNATVVVVLRETEFGHVFLLRALLWLALGVSLVAMRTRAPSRMRVCIAVAVAAAYLATLAGAGHAAAANGGTVRIVHIGADALHLLAAGAWLGALPPLVWCLMHAPSPSAVLRLAQRFSVLGIACVLVLIASGIVNSLFLVGSFAALFGTAYGQLLDVKLALFAAMLAIAATNRFRLTPRLASGDTSRRSLRRNAMLEIAGGVGIVGIVGALGTMVPGAHSTIRWPFALTFDVEQREIVAAFPTTYATSPVPYDVKAVARGAARYASECSRCHGVDARGNGRAAEPATKPADLALHGLHHPEGNLYWWIAHGIAGTAMPAFSPQIGDTGIWETVQYIVARASAEAARSIGPRVDDTSMARAPDFSYETQGQRQRTLAGERKPALIVLYASPRSGARLSQLASDHRLMHADLRVIAIPLPGSPSDDGDRATQTRVGADVASVYAMFAGTSGGAALAHTELLVDANGIVRARWIGLPASGADRDNEIVAASQHMPPPSRMPAGMHHGH